MIASLALALVLGQGIVPGLRGRVCHDELGEGSLCGWGYVQLPLVTAPVYAFFEFAPSNGAGMGTACAGTVITGAKGEPVTFTRASTATCTKGNPTTGIQPGDLVTVAVDQPRVGNPDGLGLALLVEKMSQNVLGKSEQLDNATYWSKVETSGTVTVTANQALSPFNTMTAERLQVAACPTTGTRSMLYQGQVQAGSHIASVFLMGTSTTQAVNVCAFGTTGACAPCTVPATSYTRCAAPVTTGGALAYLLVGCNNDTVNYTGASNTGAADVYIFGAQVEAGTVTTSYIPTDTVAVTRAGESAYLPFTANLTPSGSAAVTLVFTRYVPSAGLDFTTGGGLSIEFLAPYTASNTSFAVYSGGVVASQTVPNMSTTASRLGAYWTGTSFTTYFNGATATGTGSAVGAPLQKLWLGDYNGSHQIGGYIRNVCVDPDPTRCR